MEEHIWVDARPRAHYWTITTIHRWLVQFYQGGESLHAQWAADHIRPLPVTLRGYQWVLTGQDRHSGQRFAYLVVDVNAQNTIEGLEQNLLHEFGAPIIFLESKEHSLRPIVWGQFNDNS